MFKFRKIASVLASTIMVSSTIALAAAANFPAPFVSNGSANVAIVYGSAQVGGTDFLAASDIQSTLQTKLVSQTATGSSSTSSTVSGGDYVRLDRPSSKLHLGKGVVDVFGRAITDEDMDTLLADGVFMNDDNNEYDYVQKINVANLSLLMFEDSDYKSDAPSLGFRIASGESILNYTLDFTEKPNFDNKLETSDLIIMGKTYYILDQQNSSTNTLTLLDSANTQVVSEGETKTVVVGDKKYDVSISFIGATSAKLSVNGKITNSLSAGQTYKLGDGSYLGVKDVLYTSKESGISKVEFSIGTGKLVLASGSEVEMNEQTITGLTAFVENSTSGTSNTLSKIILRWNADGDQFVASDKELTMPGFGAVKLSSPGMVFPTEEEIRIENDGKDSVQLIAPIKDGDVSLNLLFINTTTGNYTVVGKEASKQLLTNSSAGSSITFDGDVHENFITSWNDGKDAESYVLYATSFTVDNTINKTTIKKRNDASYSKQVQAGDSILLGNAQLTVGAIDKDGKSIVLTAADSYTKFNALYTKSGMKVYLPYTVNSSGAQLAGALNLNTASQGLGGGLASFSLVLSEEDKDGNIGAGQNITLTIGRTATDYDTTVSGVAFTKGSSAEEVESSDVYRSFAYSALATEVLHDQGPTQQKVKLVYHGDESYGELFLTALDASITSSGGSTTLGNPVIKDSEVASATGKNLIVVGGSCVNTVAAQLLGSSTPICGADFTAKTGIASGQFLIQTFDRTGGKVATLVAGYNAQDTSNAATYLRTNTVDTTVGKKYVGTSATSATLQTTTA